MDQHAIGNVSSELEQPGGVRHFAQIALCVQLDSCE